MQLQTEFLAMHQSAQVIIATTITAYTWLYHWLWVSEFTFKFNYLCSQDGNSPLHILCREHDFDAVQLLLQHKPNSLIVNKVVIMRTSYLINCLCVNTATFLYMLKLYWRYNRMETPPFIWCVKVRMPIMSSHIVWLPMILQPLIV